MRDAGRQQPVCLAIEGLTKRFGGFYALNDLAMEVTRGHIHALIGPNGAGKTTLLQSRDRRAAGRRAARSSSRDR